MPPNVYFTVWMFMCDNKFHDGVYFLSLEMSVYREGGEGSDICDWLVTFEFLGSIGLLCMYVCYVCMYVCRYVGRYVCMYVCLYVCMSVCLYVCMSVCLYVCMHACTYIVIIIL